jgi:hypothetical protein
MTSRVGEMIMMDIGQGDSKKWVVLADPSGNEFCVMPKVVAPEPEPFHSC